MLGRSGTRLSHRVILTALPLLISASFGNANGKSSSESSKNLEARSSSRSTDDKKFRQVSLLKYSSSPDEYNPFDPQDILRDAAERKLHTTMTSTSSESDKSRSGNQKFLNSKPFPFLVNTKGEAQSYRNPSISDCFLAKNCLPQDDGADWATSYSVLDKFQNKPDVFRQKLGTIFENEQISIGDHKTQTLSIPFIVKAEDKATKPDGNALYPTGTRRVRTTTPSTDPNWVKLEPLDSPRTTYDPFTLSKNGSSEESNSTSLFASRIGVELNPETFAERHGWKDGKYSGPGVSKLPAWLEELNYQHGGYGGNRRQGFEPERPSGNYDRDREDNNRWVKLDAVPVAGVKISKWVPKNTAPSELPSTNWRHHSKPSWSDRMDTYDNSFGGQQKPHNNRSPPYPPPPSSPWPSRYPQQRPTNHQRPHQHHPSDAWSDVIYPNNPISATASWANDNKPQGSQPIGVGWPKNPLPVSRYPVASWSAPSSAENGRPGNGYNGENPYQFSRPPRPSYGEGRPPHYPDPDKDDQQWVLISSSKNTQLQGAPSNIGNKYSVYDEYPYPFNNNRHSKRINLTKLDKLDSVIPTRPIMTQDELFHRTNQTLHSLRPVLGGHRDQPPETPALSQTLIDMLTSTAANIVESTTMKYNSMGRSTTPDGYGTSEAPARKKRLFDPAAAAATSMIPSTFGAIVPMVFGRKRREVPVGHFEVGGKFPNLGKVQIRTK